MFVYAPSMSGTRSASAGSIRSMQRVAGAAADEDVDDGARGEPERADDLRRAVRRDRGDPEAEHERRSDERGERKPRRRGR